MIRKVDISHKTIFFIAAFLGILWVLYLIKDVILILFVAIILMSAISPAVERLVLIKVPKTLAIVLIYLLVLFVIGILIYLVVTPMVEQTASLATSFPVILENILPPGTINHNLIEERLADFSGNVVTYTLTIFSNFVTVVSVAVLTFYLLLDKERFEKSVAQFFGNRQERATKIIQNIELKLGAWLRGQIVLSVIIGVASYILLLAFNIPFALPLAILAGLMEVVPVIGPIIAGIPAVLIAYTVSPTLAAVIGGGFLLIQQLENHIIVPQVMKRAVGLNPLAVILGVAIGSRILGIAGALLAVPIIVVIQIIVEDVLKDEDISVLSE